ncbi:hypothetical protein IEO21_04474 [Rhodonia placenta]|uniref:Selenoprotein O n=1 Tax=Rhodonia placenta TaxID=104341 RepID=A0A8H7U2I6_9APHY|nr:hypothetical protein IEO21_04474 [Postia placenta]
MSRNSKVPISALPLPPPAQSITHNLTPDHEATTPAEFRQLLAERPSVQHRSHLIEPDAHFAYVTPYPLPFPYRIALPEDGEPVDDKAAYVEKWLAQREALHERPTVAPSALKKYYPEKRDQPRVLIALAETALRDCLPHLDVGDAFATLGTPTLSDAYGDDVQPTPASNEDAAARQELIDVLSGQAVLMNTEGDRATHWAPWSLRLFALRSLLDALAPLIGAEAEFGKALPPGWTEEIPSGKINEWRKRGIELVEEELENVAIETSAAEYGRLMHKRLGLRRLDTDDESKLARPLLDLLAEHKLDFHGTFRRLAFFRPSALSVQDRSSAFIESVLELCGEPQVINREKAKEDLQVWLQQWAARVESEAQEWTTGEGSVDEQRERDMKAANPRFVLRQWVLEEIIKNVERDVDSGKRLLGKVLQVCIQSSKT